MASSTQVYLVAVSVLLLVGLFFLLEESRKESYEDYEMYTKQIEIDKTFLAEKWIVVTTINDPTEALVKFSKLEGWQLLVVGDLKTPTNWKLPGAIFLSTEDQLKQPYSLLKHIPFKSYARKNIGYLYAIQHGAKVVYESDDDNLPYDQILVLEETSKSHVYTGYSDTVNPYAHFGYPNIWPRGYPLAHVYDDKREDTHFEEKTVCISVQQGLANKDPDVDAIWRLTQTELIGTVKFDEKVPSPISLPPGTISPYNTQNTVQHYSALWGLLLPITTSFRVCDIWRGYWVQRLLWDVGCQLSFTKALVYQDRNAHDYFKDFMEELALYTLSEDLIHFLIEWRSSNDSLEDRMIQLSLDMTLKGFWAIEDYELMKAWVSDLKMVGYVFPKVSDSNWQVDVLQKKKTWTRLFKK